MVVTPNRRLARFLHRDFDLAQRARGLTAWATPSILPYPQWLEALWTDAVADDAATDAALLLTPAQSALQWRHLVETDEQRVPLLDPRGAAELAADAWSLVHQWGAGGESWRAWRQDSSDADDPAVFARWAEAYAAGLHAVHGLDLALLPDALAALGGRLGRNLRPTVLAGFLELTPQQERLFAALRAAGGNLQNLDSLPDLDVNASRTVAATPRDEIAAALAWAREHAFARPEARIGIVVEDLAARRDEIVALAQDLLCPGAILPGATSSAPFEISLGIALADVPLIGTALDLIALAESPLPIGNAAVALRSAYLPAAEAEWPRRARIERDWIEEGRREVTLADAIAALQRCSPSSRRAGARDAMHGGTPGDRARANGRTAGGHGSPPPVGPDCVPSTVANTRHAKRGNGYSRNSRASGRSRLDSRPRARSPRCGR